MEYLHIDTLYMELTYACNQRCRHCYLDCGLHQEIAPMTTEQIKGILREYKKQGGSYLILTGGEPLMRKDIFEILDEAEHLEIPFSFASNGLAMTRKRLERLAGYQYLDLYFTSILGGNAEEHQKICGKDSFMQVLSAIQFMTERKKQVYVQVTLAKSYLHEMEEIAEWLMQYPGCVVKFTPIGTLGVKNGYEAEQGKELLVPWEEFAGFYKRVDKLKQQYPDRIESSNISMQTEVQELIHSHRKQNLYAVEDGFLCVRPDGTLSFSCNLGNPYVFGKAYESIRIPVDEKLLAYAEVVREAEKRALEEAGHKPVEIDVTIDRYIREETEKVSSV